MRLIVARRVSGSRMAVMSRAVATVLNMPRKDAMACAFCLRWYACEDLPRRLWCQLAARCWEAVGAKISQ